MGLPPQPLRILAPSCWLSLLSFKLCHSKTLSPTWVSEPPTWKLSWNLVFKIIWPGHYLLSVFGCFLLMMFGFMFKRQFQWAAVVTPISEHSSWTSIDSWEDAVCAWTQLFCKDLQLHLVLEKCTETARHHRNATATAAPLEDWWALFIWPPVWTFFFKTETGATHWKWDPDLIPKRWPRYTEMVF